MGKDMMIQKNICILLCMGGVKMCMVALYISLTNIIDFYEPSKKN